MSVGFVEYTENQNEYEFSEKDVWRVADRSAGRYSNRLIWEWCKAVEREGVLTIDLSSCLNVVQRACYIRALQEIKADGEFSVIRKGNDLFVIKGE